MSMLQAQSISIRRNGRWILHDVTLPLVSGELVAVVGPNGSGKSTLLRALAGVWKLNRGQVALNGVDITELPRRAVARQVALVPQERSLDFSYTVEEVVAMGRYPHRGKFARETAHDRTIVENAMERCDLAHLRGRPVNTLSGGEHQRVLIARSLAVQPEFILLDEPTANLDAEHAIQVHCICRELAREGHAVALATHDLNSATRYATRVALLNSGYLVKAGYAADVLTPKNIELVFQVQAEVVRASRGEPVYLFHPKNGD